MGRLSTKSVLRTRASRRYPRSTDRAPDLAAASGLGCCRRWLRNRLFFIPRQRANHAIGRLAAQIGASSANVTKTACCRCDTSVLQSSGCARRADATAPVTRRHASERMRGHRGLDPTTRQIPAANSHFLITVGRCRHSRMTGERAGSLIRWQNCRRQRCKKYTS
jgi:hypothetical protein